MEKQNAIMQNNFTYTVRVNFGTYVNKFFNQLILVYRILKNAEKVCKISNKNLINYF